MHFRNVKSRQSLSSLDLLKGFEAAARNLSFTLAGEELFLTQSAVSRQVKAIEEQLGVVLFERRHRALLLTESGQLLYKTTADILRQLEETIARLRRTDAPRMVSVTTFPAFASLWLIPRLGDFRGRHPGIDVRVSTSDQILDLKREHFDVALRCCAPDAAPSGAVRLFGEEVYPVCSRALLRLRERPLAQPEDLCHHVLLQLDEAPTRWPWLDWSVWLRAMGVADLKPAGMLRFSQSDQLVQAALDGQGVALGRSPLVKRLVREGRLAVPFDRSAASSRAYFLVVEAGAAQRDEVRRFCEWLDGTAQRDAGEEQRVAAKPAAARKPVATSRTASSRSKRKAQ